ncbi:hypothetical protein PR202_ga20635 [Eleusine coracana subsp. coracana]|uniref:Protein kinase domain-containing protein n=1 Tax=Eleusine coracana subsp. coracana TaxID=191504 RepID=A0AAV5CZA1_ELECO|nr:hypothetical protein PR202_ga20635 [Eleusine coracana subsp. coracana]
MFEMEVDNEDIVDEIDNVDELREHERLHLGIDDNHTPANPDVDIDMGTSEWPNMVGGGGLVKSVVSLYKTAMPGKRGRPSAAEESRSGRGRGLAWCSLQEIMIAMSMASWVFWIFDNKAERVLGELLDFYRCETGYKNRAKIVAHHACPKLVRNMFYEAHIQAVIVYHVQHLKVKVTKTQARNMKLTRDEYMQSVSHDGRPCTQFVAFAIAYKGKATAPDVQYNTEAPPTAYSNSSVHTRLTEYTSMGRDIHGPEWDPITHDLDEEVVMRVGGGKKHGRYWIGEGMLDTATTPTLSAIRARSTSSIPAIRPRPNTTQSQSQLAVERKAREDMEQDFGRRLKHHQQQLTQWDGISWLEFSVVVAAMLASVGAPPPQPSSKCQRKCGNVEIPYPFGLSTGLPDNCAIPGFDLTCNSSGNGVQLLAGNVEVLEILLHKGQALMLNEISSFCYNTISKEMDHNDWQLNFTGTPYSFSTSNMFTVIGCQALAYIQDEDNTGRYMSGCVAMCRRGDTTTLTNGSCSGIGCCQTAIPKGMEYYSVSFDGNFNTSSIYNVSRCNFAVLMDSSHFNFVTSYPTSLQFNKTYNGKAPLVADWASGDKKTCEAARKEPDTYLCVSNNSECFDSPNGKGYICNCSKGFEGNPYLQDLEVGCKGICVSVLTTLILFLGKEWIKHKRHIARQDHARKINECFERNGGQLLIDMMNVESNISFKLYGREEVELATNNFADSAIIGEGGQGTVYIGHNLDKDNNPVAIKRCKGFDESRRMDFGKELLILSRVNHGNIVKLLGCSLQFDIPVLVYEYVPNRTLHYLIHSHDDNKDIRTLDIRLKIATKSAEALAYLHSLNHPIMHGDVKSANILLGPDLSPKVSDFGCSMITSTVENIQVVKGTLGYLDPEYLLKFELTDKSDVYSFGVLLLELLTRKKVISKEKECLALVFQEALKKGNHHELLDSEIIVDDQDNMDVVHQIAHVAARCLVMPAEHRPTMREVGEELKLLEGVVKQRPGVLFNSDRLLMVPERSATNMSEFYSGEETTDFDSLKKKAWMSIEFAR